MWTDALDLDKRSEALASPAFFPAAEPGGDFAREDASLVLGRIFTQGMTGRLVAEREGEEKAIYFEAGRPVCATSNRPSDRMIEMLARQGRVTDAQRLLAVAAAAGGGRRMGALLVELGLVKTNELIALVRRHYEEILLSLFSWTAGRWELERGALAAPDQNKLLRHPAALAREGVGTYSLERLWARIGSGKNVFSLDLRPDALDVAHEVAGSAEDRELLILFDGVHSLDDILAGGRWVARRVLEIAVALSAFGVLRPADERPARAGLTGDRDIERARIRARHAHAQEGDYFQVLGIAREASPEEIRSACDRIWAELDSNAIGSDLARELAPEIETIREVVEDARRVLASAVLRAQYRAALSGAGT